jgi:hypothetical protein
VTSCAVRLSVLLRMLPTHLRNCLLCLLTALLCAGCGQAPHFPQFDAEIDGLKRLELVEGEEALKEINQLHGKTIQAKRGFIARYENGHEKATIWVSEAASQDAARDQVSVMLDKMKSNPRSPFLNYRTLDGQESPVVAFDGLGQTHYIFREGNWVYWIGTDEKHIGGLLEHLRQH